MVLDSVKEKWDVQFSSSHFLEYNITINQVPISILYTTGRIGHTARTDPNTCPFDDYPDAGIYHGYDACIPDYFLAANKYPITQHHFILPSKKHFSMQENTHLGKDLGQMIAFSEASGMTIFHNSPLGGASIPQHEHFQAIAHEAPLLSLQVEYLSRGDISIGYFPAYFGANLVLKGKESPALAMEYIKRFPEYLSSQNILIFKDEIILFPRKILRSLTLQRNIGGCELLGYIPFIEREKALEMKAEENLEKIRQGYEEVLFPMDIVGKLTK